VETLSLVLSLPPLPLPSLRFFQVPAGRDCVTISESSFSPREGSPGSVGRTSRSLFLRLSSPRPFPPAAFLRMRARWVVLCHFVPPTLLLLIFPPSSIIFIKEEADVGLHRPFLSPSDFLRPTPPHSVPPSAALSSPWFTVLLPPPRSQVRDFGALLLLRSCRLPSRPP